MKNIAIVTGASSGIGREFAHRLDSGSGGPLDEIWLVARRQDRLEAVRHACATPVRLFALDLTDQSSFDVIEAALGEDDSINVQWLVNSAGFGKFGDFGQIGETGNAKMVRLNVLATVQMCYHALMRMHSGSRIVNMASAAAFVPQPGLSVYAASKSFVLSFSRGLDHELAPVGIHVTAVCPKFMHTEFLDRPGNQETVGHVAWVGFEDPKRVVRKAIEAGILGRPVCIPSLGMKAANVACRVLPTGFVMAAEEFVGNWATQRLT